MTNTGRGKNLIQRLAGLNGLSFKRKQTDLELIQGIEGADTLYTLPGANNLIGRAVFN